MEDDGPQPFGAGSHVLPFPEEQRTSPSLRSLLAPQCAQSIRLRTLLPRRRVRSASLRSEGTLRFRPSRPIVPAELADVATVASADAIVTLCLPSAASAARRELSLAALRNEFEVTFRTLRFEFVAHLPPMFDGVCDEVYFVPPYRLPPRGEDPQDVETRVALRNYVHLARSRPVGSSANSRRRSGSSCSSSLSSASCCRSRLVLEISAV